MYACTDDPTNMAAPQDASFSHDGAPGVDLHLDPGGSTRTVAVNQALWQYPQQFSGSAVLFPFLRVANNGLEEGFNSDGPPYLDTQDGPNTNPLPLNHVPVVVEPGQGTTLWREFLLDANESNTQPGPQFAIRRWDLWMCDDPAAVTYSTVADFASNPQCLKVYTLDGGTNNGAVLRASAQFQPGSGQADYRILVPNPLFASALTDLGNSPADCPYQGRLAAACGVYLVLHTTMGSDGVGVEADWTTEGPVEEHTVLERPVQLLTLVKQIVNDDGGTATVGAFSINTTAGPLVFGAPTVNGSTSTYTSAQLSVPPGTFSLVEGTVAGYANGSWSCTGATSFVSTFNAGSVTISDNQTVTCSIVNNDTPATRLTLVKVVTNNNGGTATLGNFPLSAAGPTPITNQISGTAGATNVNVSPGSYVLSEQTVAGYQASSWACNGGSQSGSTITLAEGESATCTIGNDDITARLTLVKVVTNDNGGTATLGSFPLSAAGPTPITNQISGTLGATNVNVNAGSYVLSEQTLANYTATAWACSGGSLSGNTVTLGLAQSATCTIGNDDVGVTGGSVMLQNGSFTLLQDVPIDALSGSFKVKNTTGMQQSVQIQSVAILSPAVARVGMGNEIQVGISGCTFTPGAGTVIPPNGTLTIQVSGCDLSQPLAQNSELRFVVRVVPNGGQPSENTYKARAN